VALILGVPHSLLLILFLLGSRRVQLWTSGPALLIYLLQMFLAANLLYLGWHDGARDDPHPTARSVSLARCDAHQDRTGIDKPDQSLSSHGGAFCGLQLHLCRNGDLLCRVAVSGG